MAKKQFKAESRRILDLMIDSIYTHKEIFLRELISNASDAIDKLYFLSLTDDKVGKSREDFEIRITTDKIAPYWLTSVLLISGYMITGSVTTFGAPIKMTATAS